MVDTDMATLKKVKRGLGRLRVQGVYTLAIAPSELSLWFSTQVRVNVYLEAT